jgi:Putative zinc-finger
MTCLMENYLGAYVLDALEPAETEDVRRHLAGCPGCSETVRSLEWIPGVLAAVPLQEIDALDRPVLLDGLLAKARRQRRTRRLALAAAAVVLAVAGGVSVPLLTPDESAPVVRASNAGVTAEVSLTARGEGTALGLKLSGVAPGERCSLVARARDGRTETAATWVATYTGTADLSGTTAIPRAQLTALDVVTEDGRLLVRLALN